MPARPSPRTQRLARVLPVAYLVVLSAVGVALMLADHVTVGLVLVGVGVVLGLLGMWDARRRTSQSTGSSLEDRLSGRVPVYRRQRRQ